MTINITSIEFISQFLGAVMKFPSLSVVIMAYNEEENLPLQIKRSLNFLEENATDFEIIVVDDGSSDRTGEIADFYAQRDKRIKVVHHEKNLGMGVAIRSGYKIAKKEFVTQLPGDAQVHPQQLLKFLSFIEKYDLILSKYEDRGEGFLRRFVSFSFKNVARIITGKPCDFTGTMIFRRILLEWIKLKSNTFFVNFELPLILMKKGVKPAFVQINAEERRHGKSKVFSFRKILKLLAEMIKFRMYE